MVLPDNIDHKLITKKNVANALFQFENMQLSAMYELITGNDIKTAHVFERTLKGKTIEESLFDFVNTVLNFQKIPKMILHCKNVNNAVPIEIGKKIRSIIPLKKEDSPSTMKVIEDPRKKPSVDLCIITLNTGI